jgi:hypothetical protein
MPNKEIHLAEINYKKYFDEIKIMQNSPRRTEVWEAH